VQHDQGLGRRRAFVGEKAVDETDVVRHALGPRSSSGV
jgi:hypothetical protein